MPMGVSVDTKTNRQIMPVSVSVTTIKKWMISGVRRPPTGFGNYVSPVHLGQAVGVTALKMPVCVSVDTVKKGRSIRKGQTTPIGETMGTHPELAVRTMQSLELWVRRSCHTQL